MNLTDLEVFVNAATLGGLTRASERMGLSKSIISRRLSKLETELGTRLLTRTTRGISLTEAGSELLERGLRILAEEADARSALAGRNGELAGRLRLAASVSFGVAHLAPVIADFAVLHPRLELDVSYGDRVHDIVGEGFDAAVRIGQLEASSLVARRIAPLNLALAASPAYLDKYGMPEKPADLSERDVLIYTGSRDPSVWQFATSPRSTGVRVHGRIRSDSGDALRAAALAGLGIGLFPRFMIYNDLISGALKPVLIGHQPSSFTLHFIRPAGPSNLKLKTLSDYLVKRLGGSQPWDMPDLS
ncbi:LysR family transcriptional regulator [soil metagenome]